MRITVRGLGLIGLLGGLGGAINAWLCYAKLPVPIGGVNIDEPSAMQFHWSVMPGGAAHGALLALIPTIAALRLSRMTWPIKVGAVPIVGWVSGWLSWSAMSVAMNLQEQGAKTLIGVFGWPLQVANEGSDALWFPYCYFGFVGLLLFVLLLSPLIEKAARRFWVSVALSVGSGVLGSLWWWIIWGRWYFSLIHGTIWGVLVGFGVWKATRENSLLADNAVFQGPVPRDLSRRHDRYLDEPH